jgi:hypothetical protein
MNLVITILVMSLMSPAGISQKGSLRHSGNEPQVFYYDGKSLAKLNTIFVPSVRQEKFNFFVRSNYELKFASVDSTEVGMCLVDLSAMRAMRLNGRWYKIAWETELRTGSEKHSLLLTARSGSVFKKTFFINVEGTKKLENPPGVNR